MSFFKDEAKRQKQAQLFTNLLADPSFTVEMLVDVVDIAMEVAMDAERDAIIESLSLLPPNLTLKDAQALLRQGVAIDKAIRNEGTV